MSCVGVASEVHMNRFLKHKDVLAIIGISSSSMYRDIARGAFPRPRRLGARSVAWREDEVLEWIETRPKAGLAQEKQI